MNAHWTNPVWWAMVTFVAFAVVSFTGLMCTMLVSRATGW
jgi:hypothetical protein